PATSSDRRADGSDVSRGTSVVSGRAEIGRRFLLGSSRISNRRFPGARLRDSFAEARFSSWRSRRVRTRLPPADDGSLTATGRRDAPLIRPPHSEQLLQERPGRPPPVGTLLWSTHRTRPGEGRPIRSRDSSPAGCLL